MHSLMLIMLEDAYRAASMAHWHSAQVYLRTALGLANSLHDKRRAALILAALSHVRRAHAAERPSAMIQRGPIMLTVA
jgi:uncharacterized protein HemY